MSAGTPAPLLSTKLHAPPPRPGVVPRPRLMERLDEGALTGLTLVSAPAGFGKSTLVGQWAAACGRPVAWLSLDERDDDPSSFLTYLVAALRTIAPDVGRTVVAVLQSPQPPPVDAVLTTLLNEIAAVPDELVLVLDDYHVLDSRPDDEILAFMLEHLPPQLHLVIATREDPRLPLARLRARGQLTELRAADLRFAPDEAAEFLQRAMGLDLTPEHITALDARTEGWIAGLQMAAISLQGAPDPAAFVESFTGSHRFVLDYLMEEVLQRQPDDIRTFLLAHLRPRPLVRTAVRCGPAVSGRLRRRDPAGPRARQPLHRPPGRRAALVPLPPALPRSAAAPARAECCRRRRSPACTSAPATGASTTGTCSRPSVTRPWPATWSAPRASSTAAAWTCICAASCCPSSSGSPRCPGRCSTPDRGCGSAGPRWR